MEKLNLHEDILVEVLCRLPKKSLAKFKCVSKRWRGLISDRSRVFPKTTMTHSGLVCQSFLPLHFRLNASANDLEQHHSRMNFLRVDNKGSAYCLPPSPLSYNIVDEEKCLLISSCHGFLLFRREMLKKRRLDFVVLHPAAKLSWNLSRPRNPDGMHIGLVSDRHHFKLVVFSSASEQGSSGAWFAADIYSSENEEWSAEKWQSPSVTIPRRGNRTTDSAKSVFLNGAFHWIWSKYLLIYRLGKADCKLIKFPPFPKIGGKRKRQDQCIWDSEGYLNYCQVSATGDRIRIWTLHKGEWNHKQNEYSFQWKEKHEGVLAPPPAAEIKHHISFSPVAFNDDFEIVYLMFGRSIFSYNLATKEMKEACTSPFEEADDRALCIFLPILDLSQFDKASGKTRIRELCSPCSDGTLKRRKLQVSSSMEDVIFHEDIVVEILCHLPKKSLARFKCVSKHWLCLISNRNRVFPKASKAGLICQSFLPLHFRPNASANDLEQHHSQMNFLRVNNKGSASCLPPSPLSYNIVDEEKCLLISSCHGFLLFRRERLKKRRLDFVVSHPATKLSWDLSCPRNPDGMHIGLVSDRHHFKLIVFSSACEQGSSGAWFTTDIYSSENEEWSVEKWHSSSVTIPHCGNRTMDSAKSVFLNGAFHWIWRKYLLIYCLGKADCKLIKFPPFPKTGGHRKRQDQCIWDSEGYLNYCQVSATGDRIRIWTLLHKGEWNRKQNEYSFQWKEKHEGILAPTPVAEIKHHISFSPVAFNDDFEIVYLMFGRSIFSYNLATKEMKEACTSPFEEADDRALCTFLPIQDLSHFHIASGKTRIRELCSPCSDGTLKRRKLQVSSSMEDVIFHEDIVVEILCHLPKKSLARFKCVSKHWLSLISDHNRVFPKASQAGLVCQSFLPLHFRLNASTNDLEQYHSRMHFLRVDNKGSASSLTFSRLTNNIVNEDNCFLISSCNGFLLFRKEQKSKRSSGFVVFHPATRHSWNLSQPRNPDGMHIGLVSDRHHFKLVVFSSASEQGSSGAWFTSDIYSSENEEWSVEKWHSPSVTIPHRGNRTMDSAKSVFLNSAFHWIWSKYLLIYHLGKADCKLIKFPPFPKTGGHRKRQDQCIWDSEGYLNYCQVSATGDRIRIWTLHKGEWNQKQNEYSFQWKEKHEGILAPPPAAEIKHHISFSPVAFNDDFEIVYLMFGRSIFSYNLATKEVKEACTSAFEGSDDRALCISLPILDLNLFHIAAAKTRVSELGSPCSDRMLKRRKLP